MPLQGRRCVPKPELVHSHTRPVDCWKRLPTLVKRLVAQVAAQNWGVFCRHIQLLEAFRHIRVYCMLKVRITRCHGILKRQSGGGSYSYARFVIFEAIPDFRSDGTKCTGGTVESQERASLGLGLLTTKAQDDPSLTSVHTICSLEKIDNGIRKQGRRQSVPGRLVKSLTI